MRKIIKTTAALLSVATVMMVTAMTAMAATAQDVTAKNPTSYTAGSGSVYGAKLTQDQLNAVAQAAADFKTNYITDSMNSDQKIRAGYDYIKNNVAYIDWRESTYANTAYGCLVEKRAACSGMTRAFVALMDAVDVKSYWIHGATNDHQWNMVEFNDGFYFIDIDANIASGGEYIYKAANHPYAYDTAAYPAIGSKSGASTSGTAATVTEGWKQDNTGWWYQNADGSYPMNTWKEIDGKQYYFGGNGYMLANTTTPDGYQVGADGAWIQNAGQVTNDGVHTMRASDPEIMNDNAAVSIGMVDTHEKTIYNNLNCLLLNSNEFTFKFEKTENKIDPNGHEIWVVGYTFTNGIPFVIGEPKVIPFEYDKVYTLDYTGTHPTESLFYQYCKQNDLVIAISVVDSYAAGIKEYNALTWYTKYR